MSHPETDRRTFRRYPSKARARVFRAHGLMRLGIEAVVSEVSTAGVTLVLSEPFEVGDPLTAEVENSIDDSRSARPEDRSGRWLDRLEPT